jgi:hypothetical protein
MAMSESEWHDYVEQCPHCKKYLTYEQAKGHQCTSQIANIKEIPVSYCYQLTDDNGIKTVIAHGFDGILYRLVECKNPASRLSSDDGYHDGSNRRKVNRTSLKVERFSE